MDSQGYEIIHIEDSKGFRENIEKAALERGFRYTGIGCLDDLTRCIDKSNSRIFIVDDHFPRVAGGKALPLAREAIGMILRELPNAHVCMYAFEAEPIAWQRGIEYFDKSTCTPARVIDNLLDTLKCGVPPMLIVDMGSD